jgi:tripeptide aminopeptidase
LTTLADNVLERFLRYVRIDTQSDFTAPGYPTTAKQFDLLRRLATELEQIGARDVTLDEHGYVMATVPATTQKTGVPVIGFLAHVDTSPEMSGTGVQPIVHPAYPGGPIALPDDPTAVLTLENSPELADAVGHDLVTSSGSTLLGADDKAGVAEIMAGVEYLLAHPEIPHGEIRVGFTPDEEVGRGTEHFSVEKFGARYAYTLDGGGHGCVEAETFSADSLAVTFVGFNTHPGYAKGKLINSIKIAADFLTRLPKDRLSPETTEDYEGYVHPNGFHSGVERTTVELLIRDFTREGLAEKERWLTELAQATVADWPGSSCSVVVKESYRNMREVLDHHPEVVSAAEEAMARVGLPLKKKPIRGGTDGSKLSFMGLPTPNLSSGQHNIHSRLEWADVWEMEKAVLVMIEIAKIFEERG